MAGMGRDEKGGEDDDDDDDEQKREEEEEKEEEEEEWTELGWSREEAKGPGVSFIQGRKQSTSPSRAKQPSGFLSSGVAE
ncbi:hypothetical protein PG993_009666 [Apiospora rasikravindrae]|uniref:Uncharacterized protein n=1 Tax=Apiospora rasikravindrae TaxID=990691 RepID=A0ABR1SLD9_9PEZI